MRMPLQSRSALQLGDVACARMRWRESAPSSGLILSARDERTRGLLLHPARPPRGHSGGLRARLARRSLSRRHLCTAAGVAPGVRGSLGARAGAAGRSLIRRRRGFGIRRRRFLLCAFARCGRARGSRCLRAIATRAARRRCRGRRAARATLSAPEAAEARAALRRRREHCAALLQRQRLRLAILGDLGVLLLVGDVGAVTAVEHLDACVREVLDETVGVGFLLQADDLTCTLERHGVRVVLLERSVLAAVLQVGTEAPDVGDDGLVLGGLPECARELEQLHRVGERDRIHLLPRAQSRKARLLLVVLGADLHERPEAAHAHGDRLAGGRVLAELARLRDLLAGDRTLDLVDLVDEGLPELLERGGPLLLAARDGIELILHGGREAVLHVAVEMMREETVDDLADVGRHEAPVVHLDVFAVLQRRDDRGVSRGAADAVLLQRLDEGGLAVTRRRLGEVLRGGELRQAHAVAFLQRRQHVVGVIGLGVVAPFLIDRDVPGFHERRAVGAQQVALWSFGARQQVDRDRIEHRVAHLRGHGALPDQRVQPIEIVIDLALDIRRRDRRRSRADRLVSLLGVLRLGLVDARLFGNLVRAVEPRGNRTDLLNRLRRERYRVGAHVGDEADAALADVLPLVQLLGETHGAARVEAELARRLLLQRRGGEGRCRVAAALLAVDRQHAQRPGRGRGGARRCAHRILGLARRRLVGEAELLDLLAPILQELQRKGLAAVRALAFDGPVLLRDEGSDLLLALADHAQCRTLYAPRGQPAPHLLPQEWREIEADQVVESAARLLCVDELHRQAARLPDRLADGVARDLVEHHPMHVLAVEGAARIEDLLQVPGDRLTLAIGVGGEIQSLGLAERARDRRDVALVLLEHLVLHGVAALRVDRAFLGHQVTHVPIGGEHIEVPPEILLDGLRLGGGLDDDEVLCHDLPKMPDPETKNRGRAADLIQTARRRP